MIPKIRELRNEVHELKKAYDAKDQELKTLLTQCRHVWNTPMYDPERIPSPLDNYGYHYGDRYVRSPMYDRPDIVKDRWTRICSICGKAETTVAKTSIVGVKNGLKVTEETPNFGDK